MAVMVDGCAWVMKRYRAGLVRWVESEIGSMKMSGTGDRLCIMEKFGVTRVEGMV